MAKKKKATKKQAKKKVTKKKATKKQAKKKVTKKKATKKQAKKKATKKKATKKQAKKKVAKKKATKKQAKKKVTKKTSDSKPAQALAVYEAKVKVGEKVPAFTLPMTGEQTLSDKDLSGKKTVIFFYPRDHTPGCTIEAHDFTNLKPEFEDKNTVVYGVSRDSMTSHEKFKEKQSYKVDLICDENEELCAIFGVIKLKNMYGRMVRGIDRSTYVIDENGQLIKEWRKVKVPGHAQEVLDYIKSC